MSWFRTPSARSPGALVSRALPVGLSCLLLMAAVVSHARAQAGSSEGSHAGDSSNVATARALFEQGLRFVDAEQWSQAADRFSRVLELRYSAVAAYNLALAHAKLGQSVRALEELRDLLAQPALEPTVRDAAVALQREAGATVGWLTVTIRGECSDCRVMLDGLPLSAASIGVASPVNPGQHAVALVTGAGELDAADLTIARGARVDARLDATQQPSAAGPEAASPFQPQPSAASAVPAPAGALAPAGRSAADSSGSLLESPWFWGGVGVLAAGVVTLGVVLGSGGSESAPPIPGDFAPGVLSGEVRR